MSSADFKSLLNQYCQKSGVPFPKYSTSRLDESKATPLFSCSLQLSNGEVCQSKGTFGNKKSAEQDAAERALSHMGSSSETLKGGGQLNVSCSVVENETQETTGEKEAQQNIDGGTADVNNTTTSLPTNASSPPMYTSSPSTSISVPQAVMPPLTPVPTVATSKNRLNECSQKLHIPFPVYETFIDPLNLGFKSVAIFNGIAYESKGHFRLKKEAEKSAALAALLSMQNQESGATVYTAQVISTSNQMHLNEQQSRLSMSHSDSFDQSDSFYIASQQQIPGPSSPVCTSMMQGICSTPSPLMGTVATIQSISPSPQVISFKNILQEYVQQRRKGDIPKYETVLTGYGVFKSTISFCGKTLECTQGFPSKKEAEQCAAREALSSLGITDPQSLSARRKGKRRWESPVGSWGARSRKRPRLDGNYTPPKRLKLESGMVEKQAGNINFLSVGEVWKEKRNVALVGNNDTSFVLYCTRVRNSLEILNTRTMQNQLLEPGHRIIGLDGEIVEFQGKLVLEAERCADVEVPELADPVLISCGVILLHQDVKSSSHVEVLLKRYLVSQAFINVKAALAQYFRRAVIGHPMALPVESLTEYIETWKLDEVVAMATMTPSSVKQVFSSLWKFKKQWSEVLQAPLPRDLQDLQERAQKELVHRNANGINITDLENHPWSLPKGNFRHRLLTTGLHVEKPSECAARELSEETGIQLYEEDLENVPYIDLSQDDNLNPHKGDVSRYFLHVYKPTMQEQNLGFGRASAEQMSFNLEASDKDKEEQLTVLSSESGNEVDNRNINSKVSGQQEPSQECPPDTDSAMTHGSAAAPMKPTLSVLEQDLCISESSSSLSSPSSANKEISLNAKGQHEVGVHDSSAGAINTTVSQSDDNDEVQTEICATPDNKPVVTDDNELPENNVENEGEHPEERGRKRKRSYDEEEFSDSFLTPASKMTPPMYQSPSVKGGHHEECAWFPIEEAVKISPIFAEISENQTFVTFLESLTLIKL